MLVIADIRGQLDDPDGHFARHVGAHHHHRIGRQDLQRHRVEVGVGHGASFAAEELPSGSPELRLRLSDPHSGGRGQGIRVGDDQIG